MSNEDMDNLRDLAKNRVDPLQDLKDLQYLQELQEEPTSLTETDPLTGLPNRRSFDEALEREWSRTLREDGQISLLLLALGPFKQSNDRSGLATGDDALRAVSAVVLSAVRASDTVARYAAEELA